MIIPHFPNEELCVTFLTGKLRHQRDWTVWTLTPILRVMSVLPFFWLFVFLVPGIEPRASHKQGLVVFFHWATSLALTFKPKNCFLWSNTFAELFHLWLIRNGKWRTGREIQMDIMGLGVAAVICIMFECLALLKEAVPTHLRVFPMLSPSLHSHRRPMQLICLCVDSECFRGPVVSPWLPSMLVLRLQSLEWELDSSVLPLQPPPW